MKILFLPAYYFPEQIASSYLGENLREALCNDGHEIDLYAPMPSRGVSYELRNKYKHIRKETLFNGKIKVYRFSMLKEGSNPILRALRYLICCSKHFYYGLKAKNIELVYLSSTPPIQGAMGALLKKLRKIPFVYNLQDIFPDSLVSSGLAKKDGIFWKIGRIIENFTYKNADKIIVISEDFKKNIISKGVPEEKIEVIYNWVDEKKVKPIEKENNPLYKELGISPDKFNVVYAGNLGAAQNIDIILDAAERLKHINDINFIIFGFENQSAPYKAKIKEKELNNVLILPIQPFEKVSYVYSLGDVSVVSCKKGFGTIGMPSKTWNIMSSGTAVLASFDGGTDMQRIIEENEIGLFTEAENIDQFTNAISYLFKNRELCEELGKRGRNYIIKNLTREIGSKKYIKAIKSVRNKYGEN